MAAADYKLCDVCGCKTFYDAEVDYDLTTAEPLPTRVGSWAVICKPCAETHVCVVMERAALRSQSTEVK